MMKRKNGVSYGLAVLAFSMALLCAWGAAEDVFQAGFGVVEITPPQAHFHMSGYFSERVNTGVHDPLQAKAMVFEQGDLRVAVVVCDVIGLIREVTDPARRRMADELGISESHSVVTATHTHTGPLYYGVFQRYYEMKEGGAPNPDIVAYRAFLTDRIVAATALAAADLQPVKVQHGHVLAPALAFNRRFFMRDGTVRFNPGRLNPAAIRPAGPIDPEAGLIAFAPADNAVPHALFTVFSLHLDTVGGLEFSADYPYHLQQGLRERFGQAFFSVFGTGPCGDINHVDVSQQLSQKGQDEAARIGGALAEAILDGLNALSAAAPSLAMAQARFEAPLQRYTEAELAWALETVMHIEDREVPFLERVKARRIMDLSMREGETIVLEAQALRLTDDAAVVFLPGEVFVELGLGIKAASPFAHTLVVELANDNPAYIPTAKAFAEGSYEVENSRVAPGVGETLAEAARRLLYQLKYASE